MYTFVSSPILILVFDDVVLLDSQLSLLHMLSFPGSVLADLCTARTVEPTLCLPSSLVFHHFLLTLFLA